MEIEKEDDGDAVEDTDGTKEEQSNPQSGQSILLENRGEPPV